MSEILELSSERLFIYIWILLLTIFVCTRFEIKLNLIFGALVGLIIAYIYYQKDIHSDITEKKQIDTKLETIIPTPINFKDFNDIINFFYGIREFYKVDPNNFTELVKSVDDFLKIYKDMKIGVVHRKQNYDVARDMVEKSLNNMHSIIYSTEPYQHRVATRKITVAVKVLQKILYSYLQDLRDICNNNVDKNEIPIEDGQKNTLPSINSSNHFTDSLFFSNLY